VGGKKEKLMKTVFLCRAICFCFLAVLCRLIHNSIMTFYGPRFDLDYMQYPNGFAAAQRFSFGLFYPFMFSAFTIQGKRLFVEVFFF
jgi:hypothetical protein